MPEFLFTGTARMKGLDFYIEAPSLADAKRKAKAGEFDHAVESFGEMVDWEIDDASGRLNE